MTWTTYCNDSSSGKLEEQLFASFAEIVGNPGLKFWEEHTIDEGSVMWCVFLCLFFFFYNFEEDARAFSPFSIWEKNVSFPSNLIDTSTFR